MPLTLRTYGIGTGLRGYARGATGARLRWRVTLTLSTGELVTDDVQTHFGAMAIMLVKARLRRGVVVVSEEAVQS